MLAGDKVPTTAILDQLLYHCHVVHVDGSSYRLWEMEQRTRPGITGWAQVNYHHTSMLEDYMRKAEFDLFYKKSGPSFGPPDRPEDGGNGPWHEGGEVAS